MLLREPKVEFVHLEQIDTTDTSGAGYTVCEKVTGVNVGQDEVCIEYGSTTATQVEICAWFCDTSTANESNNSL